ncbi:hypothetical protein H4219_000407 [Mycoemilia scoparia]|uniref:WAC domain-containing protein n=1 Tax=Mycoemilia scoparia TaxID=417184 RepID=A0A9W8A2R1_9FUNG|nr:hypothetical protein H4219_000407 [Mycoemilia scoparia]
MPLRNGEKVECVPLPSPEFIKQDPSRKVWCIRSTGEIFTEYSQYLERLQVYRQPTWECEVTGKGGLTYEQALYSEQTARPKEPEDLDGFSTSLKVRILDYVHEKAGTIPKIAKEVIEHFQHNFSVGDRLEVRNTEYGPKDCDGLVLAIKNNGENASSITDGTEPEVVIPHTITTSVDNGNPDSSLFIVSPLDLDGRPTTGSDIEVERWQLSHPKNLFTSKKISQFLKKHGIVYSVDSSPCYSIHEKFRKKYGIGQPHELLALSRSSSENKRKRGNSDSHEKNNGVSASNKKASSKLSSQQPPNKKSKNSTKETNAEPEEDEDSDTPDDTKEIAPQIIIPKLYPAPFDPETELRIAPFKKYPIDDLDLIQLLHIKYGQGIVKDIEKLNSKSDGPKQLSLSDSWGKKPDDKTEAEPEAESTTYTITHWPKPVSTFLTPYKCIGQMMSTFIYLTSFSKPLFLSPFTLDLYETAINFPYNDPAISSDIPASERVKNLSSDAPCPPLLTELHISLLNIIIGNRKKNKSGYFSTRISRLAQALKLEADEDMRLMMESGVTNGENTTANGTSLEEANLVDGSGVNSVYENTREEDDRFVDANSKSTKPKPAKNARAKQLKTKGNGQHGRGSRGGSVVAPSSDLDSTAISDVDSVTSANTYTGYNDSIVSGDEGSAAGGRGTRKSSRLAVHSRTIQVKRSTRATRSTILRQTSSRANSRQSSVSRTKGRTSKGRQASIASSEIGESGSDGDDDDNQDEERCANGYVSSDVEGSVGTSASTRDPRLDEKRLDNSPFNVRKYLRTWATGWAKSNIRRGNKYWEHKLLGWMVEASHSYPVLQPFIKVFTASGIDEASLRKSFIGAFTVSERLSIIECLIEDSLNTNPIKQYVDECYEAIQETKRERVEVRRELRKITELFAQLDKDERAANAPPTTEQANSKGEENKEASDSAPGPTDNNNSNNSSTSEISTMASMRELSRKMSKEAHQRQLERRRLGEAEHHCLRRLEVLEKEAIRYQVGNMKPIGTDRYMNKYYYIDGLGDSLAHSTGRLFVVPCTYSERYRVSLRVPQFVMKGWDLELGPEWVIPKSSGDVSGENEDGKPNINGDINAISTLDENPFPAWGFYSHPESIDALLKWLNPKGKRELALINQIKLLTTSMTSNMRKRNQELAKYGILDWFTSNKTTNGSADKSDEVGSNGNTQMADTKDMTTSGVYPPPIPSHLGHANSALGVTAQSSNVSYAGSSRASSIDKDGLGEATKTSGTSNSKSGPGNSRSTRRSGRAKKHSNNNGNTVECTPSRFYMGYSNHLAC